MVCSHVKKGMSDQMFYSYFETGHYLVEVVKEAVREGACRLVGIAVALAIRSVQACLFLSLLRCRQLKHSDVPRALEY